MSFHYVNDLDGLEVSPSKEEMRYLEGKISLPLEVRRDMIEVLEKCEESQKEKSEAM